ncbi:unnamed protein product [Taenia asiatica]|uniref:Uncharacterized protein n=1 Tax=Taenia asiatica TaxID=60517 RepID=A0A0R3WFG7_TAEAS|nr:unnamed protein product [Taenia asiatica]
MDRSRAWQGGDTKYGGDLDATQHSSKDQSNLRKRASVASYSVSTIPSAVMYRHTIHARFPYSENVSDKDIRFDILLSPVSRFARHPVC